MLQALIAADRYKIVRSYRFLFQGANSAGPFAIKVHWSDRNAQSPNVDYLIQTVSAPIIQRMKADIERCGTARWGEHAIFGRDSITLTAPGREIPYRDIVEAKLAEGFMSGELVLRSRDNFRAKIKSKVENFYPGFYFLLDRIPAQAQPREARADVFERPVHRIRFIKASGSFLVASAMLSIPLLVPVDAFGNVFLLSLAGFLILAAGYHLWRGLKG
jgi:hypothetical protein